jgi:hypothetical protein
MTILNDRYVFGLTFLAFTSFSRDTHGDNYFAILVGCRVALLFFLGFVRNGAWSAWSHVLEQTGLSSLFSGCGPLKILSIAGHKVWAFKFFYLLCCHAEWTAKHLSLNL